VTLWTIGTEDRMEATVIGQAVNITAWLEKLTRIYNAYIIISETAFNELSTPSNYSINFLSEESIKWRQKPIKIYIVNGYSENKVSEEIIDIV
jgi:class 3 adenylate cyclase